MAHFGFYEHVSLALLNAFVVLFFFSSFDFFVCCPVALLNADRKRVQLSEKTCSIKMNICLRVQKELLAETVQSVVCALVFLRRHFSDSVDTKNT